MEFEFDSDKSDNNKKKHGIDFLEAQALWEDPDFIEIPARTTDESRFLMVGKTADRHWSGVITYREEKVRIISVRRSRNEEVDLYYMKAEKFDKRFDEGDDVSQFFDVSKARRPAQEQRRVNVDFPLWMIHELDKEAKRLGVPRQSIIKLWVSERLKKAS
jgi:uncharacterized DUF497 family protein